MQEFALLVSILLLILYIAIDHWVVTPRYFIPLYIAMAILILGLTLSAGPH